VASQLCDGAVDFDGDALLANTEGSIQLASQRVEKPAPRLVRQGRLPRRKAYGSSACAVGGVGACDCLTITWLR
jgi:hypothetical protein